MNDHVLLGAIGLPAMSSTLLTLIVIPVVYSLMDRKRWPVATGEARAAS